MRRRASASGTVRAAFVAMLIAFPAAGDPLSDLREVLNRYPATTPFAVAGTVEVTSGGEAATRTGASSFEVESGPAGFTIRVLPRALAAADAEAAAKKRDPNAPTPTRTAMVALTVFEVLDAVDAAAMLLNDLSGATLLQRRAANRRGTPATLLRVKVKPSLSTQSRFVNKPTIELRVWVGTDGVPIAAERDSEYSASFLFVKGGNLRKEKWEYSARGDRLYARRNDEIDSVKVAGKSMVTSRSVSYSPK